MGKATRKRHTAEFKVRVALDAIKGEQTLAETGAKHGIYLTMVAACKSVATEGMANSFSPKGSTPDVAASLRDVSKPHAKIGQLIKDDKFLSRAVSGQAGCIIAGDAGLLGMGAFEGVSIVRAADYVRLFSGTA